MIGLGAVILTGLMSITSASSSSPSSVMSSTVTHGKFGLSPPIPITGCGWKIKVELLLLFVL